MTDTRYLHW